MAKSDTFRLHFSGTSYIICFQYPGVAQLVARLLWEQDAASSSLATRTKKEGQHLLSFFLLCGEIRTSECSCPVDSCPIPARRNRLPNLPNLPTRTRKVKGFFAPLAFLFYVEILEKSNTSVRWTAARSRLDGIDTLIYRISPLGLKHPKEFFAPLTVEYSSSIHYNEPEPAMYFRSYLNFRRLLFEEKQHLGDCGLTGRFAPIQSQPNLPALQSTIIRRINQ